MGAVETLICWENLDIQRVSPAAVVIFEICRLLYLRLTSSDGWNIIIAKLSKNPKPKLQLLAEMVMISINPTTQPPVESQN